MLRGERTWTVEAPPAAVYAVIADVERYPDWHPFFATVDVTERDADGRPSRARCSHPASVTTLHTEIAFQYRDGEEVGARREGGDLKALDGCFTVRPEGDGSSVTQTLVVDPGMRLGMLLRGPVEERVRESVLSGAQRGLAQALG
jgi:ribosome-associated toxin RatA of RatAB toxin-antitoxin module